MVSVIPLILSLRTRMQDPHVYVVLGPLHKEDAIEGDVCPGTSPRLSIGLPKALQRSSTYRVEPIQDCIVQEG